MSNESLSSRTMRIDITPRIRDRPPEAPDPEVAVRRADTTFVGNAVRTADSASGYKKLLRGMYDAVLITDTSGRVIDFNTRATDFFRCSDWELEGTRLVGLISGGDDGLLSEICSNLETHRYALIEAHCVRRDKSLFPAEIAVSKLDLWDSGELCFLVRNITVRKQTQEALEDAVERLEMHDRARSEFISNVSHELRTPLTSMIYAVSNMMRGVAGPVSDAVRRYLEVLNGDCKRLLNTVNDILDLRKIEEKSLTLSRTTTPFLRFVEQTALSLQGQAERKGIDLIVKQGGYGCFVSCDRDKMERVILNVVNNAIKFTPDGGMVRVELSDDPVRSGNVLLSVVDNGIGIPTKSLHKVTERYFTVGEQPTGSGLGLAISKEIVELHGGSIELVSPPVGKETGTAVSLSLPVTEGPLVVVAHGDTVIRNSVALELSGRGYRVRRPDDVVNVLAEMERTVPDLVIADMMISGAEETELIFKMKNHTELSRVPIVVVTEECIDPAKLQILKGLSVPVLYVPWSGAELLDVANGAIG